MDNRSGIVLLNGERIRDPGEIGHKCFGVLVLDDIMPEEMKERVQKLQIELGSED